MLTQKGEKITRSDIIDILDASGSSRLKKAYLEYFGLKEKSERQPFQNPYICIPELSTTPWQEPKQFDWVEQFEQAYSLILEELLHLRGQGNFQLGDNPNQSFYQGNWNNYIFRQGSLIHQENCQRCPKTASLIESIPTLERFAFFAALTPGSHISPHYGIMNEHLVCQFGLTGLKGAEIRVADEVRQWESGKFLMYDGSFEHEVWNGGTQTRIVLVIFIWHPGLTAKEIETIQTIRNFIRNQYQNIEKTQQYLQAIRHNKFVIGNDNWWV
ncbi:MAG: aspartyl/asparaginyl beta-hydroxylase domain-containing protein [Xenococcaceae cyanobacterium]